MIRLEDLAQQCFQGNQEAIQNFANVLTQAVNQPQAMDPNNLTGITYKGSRIVTLLPSNVTSRSSAEQHWTQYSKQQSGQQTGSQKSPV